MKQTAFMTDYTSQCGMNANEASLLKWWILKRIKFGSCTADDIYKESECGDIAMYLALHELVINSLIIGPDPYDRAEDTFNPHGGHTKMRYKLAGSDAAIFFSDAAMMGQAELWNPDEWAVH